MKPTTQSVQRLAEIPLFEQFKEEEIGQLAEIVEPLDFQPGEIVLHQGRCSQNLWIVLEGVCEVVTQPDSQDSTIVLAELKRNNHFGEMSFFHAAPHSASVRAKTALRLLRIEKSRYDTLINGNCSAAYKLAYNTVDSLADRLRRMDEWVTELLMAEDSVSASGSADLTEWSLLRENVFGNWSL